MKKTEKKAIAYKKEFLTPLPSLLFTRAGDLSRTIDHSNLLRCYKQYQSIKNNTVAMATVTT